MKKAGKNFALKVKGESMIKAGIFEGDIVIVASGSEVKNNDIVVAMVDGEVTVKTFLKKEDKVILNPENEKFKPILVSEKNEFSILGKVTGVFRKL